MLGLDTRGTRRESDSIPAVTALRDAINARARRWADVVKIGRTQLQDAVPLTVGREWSRWAAAGGTAVGTGLNAPPGFGPDIAVQIAALTGHDFVTAPDKFEVQGGFDGIVAANAIRTPGGYRRIAATSQ